GRDRSDHAGRLVEGFQIAAFNVVTACDPSEIGVRGPDVPVLVFEHEDAHGPIESCERISADEERTTRWIAKHQKRGRTQLDTCIGSELLLIDFLEEPNALVCDILLDQ